MKNIRLRNESNRPATILFGTGFVRRIHDDFGTALARMIIPQRAFRQFDTSPTSQCAGAIKGDGVRRDKTGLE